MDGLPEHMGYETKVSTLGVDGMLQVSARYCLCFGLPSRSRKQKSSAEDTAHSGGRTWKRQSGIAWNF